MRQHTGIRFGSQPKAIWGTLYCLYTCRESGLCSLFLSVPGGFWDAGHHHYGRFSTIQVRDISPPAGDTHLKEGIRHEQEFPIASPSIAACFFSPETDETLGICWTGQGRGRELQGPFTGNVGGWGLGKPEVYSVFMMALAGMGCIFISGF